MRVKSGFGAALVAVLVLASAPTVGAYGLTGAQRRTPAQAVTDWAEFRFDQGNTGFNVAESVLGAANVAGLELAWDRDLESFITGGSSPVLKDGVLYVAAEQGYDGHVFALDPETGTTLWTTALKYVTSLSTPAVAQGKLVIGSGDSDVYALDVATGAVAW